MDGLRFEFDRDKSIEAVLYIANKIDKPDFHSITHILYFADKTSLEEHGRFICGDEYFAMVHGTVPTHTYDLLKSGAPPDEVGFRVEGYNVEPLREADTDVLSDSDIECMRQAIDMYGDVPFWKRKQDSHDEAYEEAWANRGNTLSVPIPLESTASMLENSEQLIEFLANRHSK